MWHLPRTRDGVGSGTLGNEGDPLLADVGIDGVRQVALGRGTGLGHMADEPRHFHQAAPLGGGAHVAFIGDPLGIEREHVGNRCPGVQ
jgi:hypothetical protein